jgi:Family of unknown function (DUF6445)
MHATLTPLVKGYTDGIQKIGTESIKAWGWTYYAKTNQPLPLRLASENKIYDITRIDREDVSLFYKIQSIIKCGWEVTFNRTVSSELQINIDGEWKPVFRYEAQPATPPSDVKFGIAQKIPSFLVVDNFYEDPDAVRKFALTCEFNKHPANHKGLRTDVCYRFDGLQQRFEQLIGKKIKNWESYGTNGCFQYCVAGDQLVYHHDTQQYAGVLFLTPDAPPQSGTSFYRSKYTKKMKVPADEHSKVFKNGYLDPTEFDQVDVVGNVYNRIVLFDSLMIHAANNYFGTTKENGRLFQLFFFDLE